MNDYREVDASLLKLLTDAIPLAIFLTDATGRISGWTGSAGKMLGFSESEAIGRRFDSLFAATRRAGDDYVRTVELAGRAANYKEIGVATRADGSQFLAVLTMDRVSDGRGEPVAYACTLGPV